jgi:hypothetical protein
MILTPTDIFQKITHSVDVGKRWAERFGWIPEHLSIIGEDTVSVEMWRSFLTLRQIRSDSEALRKSSRRKPTALWTFYHSLIVIELAIIIIIEAIELFS